MMKEKKNSAVPYKSFNIICLNEQLLFFCDFTLVKVIYNSTSNPVKLREFKDFTLSSQYMHDISTRNGA